MHLRVNGPRPDLAIVTPSKIVIGELTVCHETNLLRSRDYKLQKYSNLGAARADEFRGRPVLVHTVEVSTLVFVIAEPNFFRNGGILPFDPPLLKRCLERQSWLQDQYIVIDKFINFSIS